MTTKGRILIVDDDDDILIAGRLLLRRHHYDVTTCHDPKEIPALITSNQYHAVLLDMNFGPGESSGQEGLSWLNKIKTLNPHCVVVMITAHGGMNLAIKAMQLGASDFVIKPWQNEKLVATVSTAVELGEIKIEANQLRQTNQVLKQAASRAESPSILGQSAAMKNVLSLVERSAPTDANVLILGENGTGKELIARQVHQQSLRHDNIFMSVDLGAMSETLFESELFGHKKGAFTGANEDRVGRLEAADGGTLFLDEIGNLPLHLQSKLLTVLEQRTVTPLGDNQSKPFDVRVISATNITRDTLSNDSHFRQDLLFRLNTVEVNLPPLRERVDDIAPIAQHYIGFYSRKYGKAEKPISAEAKLAMNQYTWPGNVRALRHAVERAVILSESAQFSIQDFQLPQVTQNQVSQSVNSIEHKAQDGDELNLEKIEKNTISQALKTYRYNISHTAKALGLTRAALYRRMEKHGL